MDRPSEKQINDLIRVYLSMGGIQEPKIQKQSPQPQSQQKPEKKELQKPQATPMPKPKKSAPTSKPLQQPQKQEQKEEKKDPFKLYEEHMQEINKASERINKQLEELNQVRSKILDNMKNVYIQYKDKVKELMGLHLTVMSKTALNQYMDYDFSMRLGELIESLPPEALGEGIKLFQTGYLAGKFAGIDLGNKSLSEIMAYGQDPDLITKMPNEMLQLIEPINTYLPTLYEQELNAYKTELQKSELLQDKIKTQIALLETKRKSLDEYIKLLSTLNLMQYREAMLGLRKQQLGLSREKFKWQQTKQDQKQRQQTESLEQFQEILKGLKK